MERIADLQERESGKEFDEMCTREPHSCYHSAEVIRLTVLRNFEWGMYEECET
jgi:hypothetical protein